MINSAQNEIMHARPKQVPGCVEIKEEQYELEITRLSIILQIRKPPTNNMCVVIWHN